MRTPARSTGSRRSALLLSAALLLGADSAFAHPQLHCPATVRCFFGEDPGIFDDDDDDVDTPNSDDARGQFLLPLGATAGTERFEHFDSGDDATLELIFRRPRTHEKLYEGELTDRGTNDYGYIGTSEHEDRGFAISGDLFWKNRTEDDENLFRIAFEEEEPMRAFGFYATSYSTLSEKGSTQLELELKLAGGLGKIEIKIPHKLREKEGNAFFFGVISDLPFIAATLEDYGRGEDGDVIGFDNVTVSPIPEPSTGLLLAVGLLGLAANRRSRP